MNASLIEDFSLISSDRRNIRLPLNRTQLPLAIPENISAKIHFNASGEPVNVSESNAPVGRPPHWRANRGIEFGNLNWRIRADLYMNRKLLEV